MDDFDVKSTILHYLFIFDRAADRTVERREFGTDEAAALKAYPEAEHLYREQPNMDIVLVGSDSIESIRKTHSSYFEDEKSSLRNVESDLQHALEKILDEHYEGAR